MKTHERNGQNRSQWARTQWAGRMCSVITLGVVLLVASLAMSEEPAKGPAKKPDVPLPSHRVMVVYFHRTVRCPTCKRIGGLAEKSVKERFAKEVKKRSVAIKLIDFQDEKNKKFTKHYKITGPTLVVIDVRDNKVAKWKEAAKVWSLFKDPKAFGEYVESEVREYLEAK